MDNISNFSGYAGGGADYNSTSDLEERVQTYFGNRAIYKNYNAIGFIKPYKLPSFMRDWVCQKFQDDEGNIDKERAENFIKKYLPSSDDWEGIKLDLMPDLIDGEQDEYDEIIRPQRKFLGSISIEADISSSEIYFEIHSLKTGAKKGDLIVPLETYKACKNDLCCSNEKASWGLITISYVSLQEDKRKKKRGHFVLDKFEKFAPYIIDLDKYREARSHFTIDEWVDIVFGAIDYDSNGYNVDEIDKNGNICKYDKMEMLKRLLPFVENRVNLVELAPKGTGKSYVFGELCHYGWLISGGQITRAKMFYDNVRKSEGLISGNDYVALDEVQTIKLGSSADDENEIRGALKCYMENGKCNVGNQECRGDAGVLLLGNIDRADMNINRKMFGILPEAFRESALIDRFHGFIQGWKIKRVDTALHLKGKWCLNTEYFMTILHLLRSEGVYRDIVDRLTNVPNGSDGRDTEAVKRLCTAFLKLLFPHVIEPFDISEDEFCRYCLEPAKHMRFIIKKQMAMLDKEYSSKIPNITYKSPF